MRLVFMAMCRNSIRCRCQLHLISSLGYDAIACFYAGKDLYTFAIVGTQGDKLFFVSFFIQLQVDKEAALFLGQRTVRKRHTRSPLVRIIGIFLQTSRE